MTAPNPLNPASGASRPGAGLLARWSALHTAWLLFGPPAVMAGLRWILQSMDDRQTATAALPLLPVATTAGVFELLWPVAAVLALLAAVWLALRRIGWRRSLPVLGGVWLLLWLYGGAALLQRHQNRAGLFLQDGISASAGAPVLARVLASQFKPASLRSLGGTELVLQVSGQEVPQRLLINDPQAAPLKSGDALALQIVPGRFSGRFVTGWLAVPAAPTSAPAVSLPVTPGLPTPAAPH